MRIIAQRMDMQHLLDRAMMLLLWWSNVDAMQE